MSDLRELYQQVILDHNKNPRNFHEMAEATRRVDGYNPLCGDHYTIFVKTEGESIAEVSFTGSGCAISKASASMMTDALKGRTVAEADALFARFHQMVTTPPDQPVEDMGKLSSLAGVREFPVRVKCASLAWHALKSAVADDTASKVTTE